MRTPLPWLLGLAIVVGSQATVDAASLLKMELVPDGSTEPPGDRLDISVLLPPGEDQAELETRVFARLEGQGQVAPVRSKDPGRRDAQGNLLVKSALRREGDSRAVDARVVIPYAAMDLAPGRYQLGYEVRGLRQGRPEFARATPLSTINVTRNTRTTIRERVERPVPRVIRETKSVYVLEGGKPVAKEVVIETEEPRQVREIRTARVEIPGEFLRTTSSPTRGLPSPRPSPRSPSPSPRPTPAPAPSQSAGQAREAVVPLEDKPWAALSEFEPKSKRTIYYATNRVVVAAQDRSPGRFGNEAAPGVTYGSCLVNIPVENHTRGEVEQPSWWQSRDPSRFFLVEALDTLTRDFFLQCLSSDDVLLYIHGYNNGFEDAVLRSAQLVHDLKFPGLGVAFSWPSAAAVSGYGHDEQVNEASVPALVEVLKELTAPVAASRRARKVHVIVHSMGNRAFLKAARQLELDRPVGQSPKVFGHVALAAPDVDATTFAALLPSVVRQAQTATLYYCQNDKALLASRAVHLDKPVGLGPFFAEGLDTINADRANTSFLGHGYFSTANPILTDLMLTILHDQKPEQRHPPLGPRSVVLGYPHWWLVALQ